MRRSLRWVGVLLGALIAAVLGLTGAALGTEAGRNVVVSALLSYAERALRGTLTIESFDGSLYRGLELRGVKIVGEDGTTFAEIPSLRARYRLSDFLSLRITLGQLTLTDPTVTIVELPGGRLNVEEIFGLGEVKSGGGPRLLVAFSDVRITGAVLHIRTLAEDDVDPIVEISDALITYLRLSSPLPQERGVRIELERLRSTTSQLLPFDVRGARGTVEIFGDTIQVDLAELRLPNSTSTARGRFWNPTGELGLDLAFDAERVVSADLRRLLPWLRVGVSGKGSFHVASRGRDVVAVRATDLDLATIDGGRLSGTLGFAVGPGDEWAAEGVDASADGLDLDYLRGIIDTIPFDGRLSGRIRADGPRSALVVDLDWRFEDARAAGAISDLSGAGVVEFADEDVVFHDFAVREARVALATVRGVVPGIALQGTLELDGVLDGPWHDARFTGTMRQWDGGLPVSVAEGWVRIDSRGDTVGVWAELLLDSLQFDGIRPSYPSVPFIGGFAGRLALAGYLDSLALDADLAGPGGRVRGDATVVLVAPHLGFRRMDLSFTGLAIVGLEERLPQTRLAGRLRGRFETDTLVPPVVDLALGLRRFSVGGMLLDSGVVLVRSRDSLLVVDTVWAEGLGVHLAGNGRLAIRSPGTDSIVMRVDVEAVEVIAPLLASVAGRRPADVPDRVAGAIAGTLTLAGALDAIGFGGTLEGSELRWGDIAVPSVTVRARLRQDPVPALAVALDADSIAVGELGFAAVEGRIDGRPDSLRWSARARMGEDGSFIVGARLHHSGGATAVRFDSLVVLLAENVWFLERDAGLTITDSAIVLSDMTLTTASGESRILLTGAVPRRGHAVLDGRIEGLRVKEVRAMAQLPVERASGDISGTFRVSGTGERPVITAELQIQRFTLNDFRAPLTRSSVEYNNRRLAGTVTLEKDGEEILNVDVNLPIDLAFSDVAQRLLPGDLSIRARADGVDLEFLDAVNPRIRNASGRLSADFGITGTWDRPELTGFLTVVDGAVSFPGLGVRHERVNGRLELSGDTITVERLTVQAGGGSAEVRGFVRLEGLTRPELHLDVSASEFRAIDVPNFLALTASGEIHLHGPVFATTLTGNGTVTEGVLYFADIVEKEIINLEDTAFAVDSATAALIRRQGLGTTFQNRFLDSLRIDSLRLEMGSDVRLRSTEADVLLTGVVTVNKIGDQYRIDGTLQTPRGTYRLPLGPTIQKDFTVTRGEVRYFGTPDLNAALDIDARHQLRDVRGDPVTVLVNVGGTINSPTLTLSSDIQPPLSETEILSYLVFGAPTAQAAGGRFTQYGLQQTISTWASRISGQLGSALIADLGIPLDYFEIRPGFGGEGFGLAGTEIALGSQIGERWFVTLNQRICPREAFTVENLGAAIEFRMSRQWSLAASFDPLPSCFTSAAQPSEFRYQFGLDVLWEKRY